MAKKSVRVFQVLRLFCRIGMRVSKTDSYFLKNSRNFPDQYVFSNSARDISVNNILKHQYTIDWNYNTDDNFLVNIVELGQDFGYVLRYIIL